MHFFQKLKCFFGYLRTGSNWHGEVVTLEDTEATRSKVKVKIQNLHTSKNLLLLLKIVTVLTAQNKFDH